MEKSDKMVLSIDTFQHKSSYYIQKNILNEVYKYCKSFHQIIVVSDDGVPFSYMETLIKNLKNASYYIFPHGEKNKSPKTVTKLLDFLLQKEMNRDDLIIALGGGVVLDLVGFVASIFKRGISYYAIPTTLLAQVDCCIGGKTAIDYQQIKNAIGSFYVPNKIFIDSNVLNTLTKRQFNNGLFEIIKMGLIYDASLFNLIAEKNIIQNIDSIIEKAIKDKMDIVKKDPFDRNIRQILNYGHTLGHALESYYHFKHLLHGEAIAYGMLLETKQKDIQQKLCRIYKKIHFRLHKEIDSKQVLNFIKNDKKISGKYIVLPIIKEIGKCELIKITLDDFINSLGGHHYE